MTDQHRTTQNLLEKKLAAYEDFLSATCLLKSALKSVDMPLVEGAVSRRADLIGLIDDLDQELAKLRKDEPAGEGEEALAKVTADLHSTLQQIEAINVECAALAEQGYHLWPARLTVPPRSGMVYAATAAQPRPPGIQGSSVTRPEGRGCAAERMGYDFKIFFEIPITRSQEKDFPGRCSYECRCY